MTKKQRQPHPIDQSILYGLQSKSKLVEVLELGSTSALRSLVESEPNGYRAYVDEKTGRHIQYPINEMAACHTRLARLLSRIATPAYLHSKKGSSYVTNAKTHASNTPLIKTDISQYFPSTTFGHIHRMFREDLRCSPDVAWHLAKLSTYCGHVPTGSTISNPLAFLANRPMFEQINDHVQQHGCVLTVFQDDIVVSGAAASMKMLNIIKMMIRKCGLSANEKRKKTKTYPASAIKIVTGVVVKGDEITLPNRRRKLMAIADAEVRDAQGREERNQAIRKLRGRVNEADQIDPLSVHRRFRETAAS